MSYLVLARKYRPQTFDEVVEQEHITRTLVNAISSGRVAHAILFSGPRGTGKTTVARILAKAMNCKQGPAPVPCNRCRSCREITSGHAVDVYEIDGASNNSVDQIRELRENIKYMPAHSAYKIYIIDEVHMLSTAAFNALLKTLEEPPSHVMFIFATTEPHKIPVTILSRCQRHDFKRIGLDAISRHLAAVCEKEGFKISTASLTVIGREAGGSMRDALSLLDQVLSCSGGAVSDEQLLGILGVMDRKILFDVAGAVLDADIVHLLDILDDIYDRGHDMKKFYTDLLEHFRNLVVVKLGKKVEKLVDLPAHEIEKMAVQVKQASLTILNQVLDFLISQEASIRHSAQPKLVLEMAFVRLLQLKPVLPIETLIEKLDTLRRQVAGPSADPPGGQPVTAAPPVEKDAAAVAGGSPSEAGGPGFQNGGSNSGGPGANAPVLNPPDDPADAWQQIYERIAPQNPSLAASLAKCRLKKISDRSLEVEVAGNDFAVNIIRRKNNLTLLGEVCAAYFGQEREILLSTVTDSGSAGQAKKKDESVLKQKALNHPLVNDALEIFNGQVVDVKLL